MDFVAYCDGSSTGTIGDAGSAAAIFYDGKGVLIAKPLLIKTGNNVAEMAGVELILSELPANSSVTIYTDSNNTIQWLTDKFKRNNPQIKMLYKRIKKLWVDKNLHIQFVWVKGHASNKWNNLCDLAAKNARTSKKSIREEVIY